MKTWRIIAASAAAFALAATIGCNADTANDENNSAPEPVVQDGGQSGTGEPNAPADNPAPAEEGGTGEGQGAGQGTEPSTDAGGGSGPGDHPVDLPMPVDPQTDAQAPGDGGNDADGSMSILPIIEPVTEVEKTPSASGAAEPAGPGLTPPDGNASSQGAGVDPNTPVEHRASMGGSDSVAGTGPSAPADYNDGREPAPVVQAMPVPRPGQ